MQRLLLSSSRLSCRLPPTTVGTLRQITRTIAGQERDHKTPTAAEIKKNVPELWLRKVKTFFAFCDFNGDGIIDFKDYKLYENSLAEVAAANNVSKDRIENFHKIMSEVWMNQIAGGTEHRWSENECLEAMFEVVSRPGAEEYFRKSAEQMFDIVDFDGNGFISKTEHAILYNNSPWTIVAFSSLDTNHNGEISKDEFVKVYMDFWFNFADETNPSKHYLGPLLKM